MKNNIDYRKSRDFFTGLAKHPRHSDLTLVATSCPDNPPGFLLYRDRSQKRQFFKAVKIGRQWDILDMGCGTGRWTLALAEKARHAVGVDNSPELLKLAARESEKRGIRNVSFVDASVVDFSCPEKFDLIFFGSVFLYINDEDIPSVISNVKKMLKPGGMVVVLESISVKDGFIDSYIHDERSQATYSAIYRRSEEYAAMFTGNGFRIEYEKDTLPRSLPIFIYDRLVPAAMKKNRIVLALLRLGLNIQAYLDPYLADLSVFRNRAETHQKFFVFRHEN